MRSTTIEKIGFFHFVDFGESDTSANPVTKLGEAITERLQTEREKDEKWDISNSLIVLPEAFNIGRYHPQSVPQQSTQEFIEGLRELAATHQVISVAGILEGRRNSAYLIDAKVAHLMCHKIGEDLTGIYDPCTGDPDPCNPVHFRNDDCVGALICMDADDVDQPHIKRRQKDFLKRLSAYGGRKIVCVPARFSFPRQRLDCFSKMTDSWYVVAQGCANRGTGEGSFVADSSHKREAEATVENEVKIWQLPRAASQDFTPNIAEDARFL